MTFQIPNVSLSHERRRKTTGNKFMFDLSELERQTDENYEYRWYESFKLQITMW
jgi:hypothetical protein